jgi:hypothetical protein
VIAFLNTLSDNPKPLPTEAASKPAEGGKPSAEAGKPAGQPADTTAAPKN